MCKATIKSRNMHKRGKAKHFWTEIIKEEDHKGVILSFSDVFNITTIIILFLAPI